MSEQQPETEAEPKPTRKQIIAGSTAAGLVAAGLGYVVYAFAIQDHDGSTPAPKTKVTVSAKPHATHKHKAKMPTSSCCSQGGVVPTPHPAATQQPAPSRTVVKKNTKTTVIVQKTSKPKPGPTKTVTPKPTTCLPLLCSNKVLPTSLALPTR